MMEYVKILLPYIIAFIMTFVGYLLGKKKQDSEIGKTSAETRKTTGEIEISLVNFYKDKVVDLIKEVNELKTLLQQERDAKISCESKLDELEVKFNILSTKFTLLEKNLIRNNEI